MNNLYLQFESIRTFLDTGGDVLWVLLLVSIGLWSLIAERLLFFRLDYPGLQETCTEQWNSRRDKKSKEAAAVREELLSEANIKMSKSVLIIKMLVTICPLLGLLGTVMGMIHVFDVMAVMGNGNIRALASGISQATLSTMAGMVIAITGLYFSRLIEERVNDEMHHLADLLTYN